MPYKYLIKRKLVDALKHFTHNSTNYEDTHYVTAIVCKTKTVCPPVLAFLWGGSALIKYTFLSVEEKTLHKSKPQVVNHCLYRVNISLSQSVFHSVLLYLDNHLGWFPFYKIPDAQRSQVHFASSTPLIVQSGTLFRED